MFLDRTDDGSSGSIDVGADGFPFGNSSQTELYVCDKKPNHRNTYVGHYML